MNPTFALLFNLMEEGRTMRIAKQDIPVRIDVPGAVARQQMDFGDASGYGKISGEYFSFGAGPTLRPFLPDLSSDQGEF